MSTHASPGANPDAELSDEQVREKLQFYVSELEQPEQPRRTNLDYRQIRTFIRQTVIQPRAATLTLHLSNLYLNLISNVSVAYEELTFSSCIFQTARILRESANVKCTMRSCNKKTAICTAHGHISVSMYAKFWELTTDLIRKRALDCHNAAFVTIAAGGYVNIIQTSRNATLLGIALDGMKAILDTSDARLPVVTALYKAVFPLVRIPLPAQTRTCLVNVIVHTADTETRAAPPAGEDAGEADGEGSEKGMHSPKRTHFPVVKFLELCCLNVQEKADERTFVAQLVCRVLQSRREECHTLFRSFLSKSARNSKTCVRMLAIDIASLLLKGGGGERDACVVSQLVDVLLGRCNDRVPTVRAKAIHLLVDSLRALPQCDFTVVKGDLAGIAMRFAGRLRDPKSRVRKSAVELVGFACEQFILDHHTDADRMETDETENEGDKFSLFPVVVQLKQRCFDATAAVRQCAISNCTSIMRRIADSGMKGELVRYFRVWMEAVLPHVNDVDNACRESCLNAVTSVMLHSDVMRDDYELGGEAADMLVDLSIAELGSGKARVTDLARKAVMALSAKGLVGDQDLRFFCSRAKLTKNQAADRRRLQIGSWKVLEAVAASGKADDVKRRLGQDVIMDSLSSEKNLSACQIAIGLVPGMNSKAKSELETSLRAILFKIENVLDEEGGEYVRAVCELLAKLREDVGFELLEWCESWIVENGEDDLQDEQISKLLHVIGSVCVSFKFDQEPPDSVVTFVQAMTSNAQTSSKLRALALATLGKICLTEAFAAGSRKKQPRRSSGERKKIFTNRIGESLARRLVPVFVHELDNATSSATRNNAVIVLCDLCRRYTAVIEPFVSRIAGLLMDSSEFVRIQVLTSLVSLLQEDYIKIRTSALFYQIARCLLDPSESVRATAEFALLRVIAQKNSSILASSFLELTFVLNECTESANYNQFSTPGLVTAVQRPETKSFAERMQIYEVFLRGMTVEQKLRLPGRFRTGIITQISENKLSLSASSVQRVLEDALLLLPSEQVNPFSRVKGLDDPITGGVDDDIREKALSGSTSDATNGTKKASLLKKIQVLELRETTVPTLLELRHHLESSRSPLLKAVMICLCLLLRPHKDDLSIMLRDPIFRAEIKHEISHLSPQKKTGEFCATIKERSQDKENIPENHERPVVSRKRSPGSEKSPALSAKKPPTGKLSVPRTRPVKRRKAKALAILDSDDESDDDEFIPDGALGRLSSRELANRIGASPKLAAIARRTSLTYSEPSPSEPTKFAKAMARIEGEAKA